MVTSNDPTLEVSSKPCQSAQTSKTSEHAYMHARIHTVTMADVLHILSCAIHKG